MDTKAYMCPYTWTPIIHIYTYKRKRMLSQSELILVFYQLSFIWVSVLFALDDPCYYCPECWPGSFLQDNFHSCFEASSPAFTGLHRSLFCLQDALWDFLGSHHYVLANTVTPALGSLFQGIAECLMTPRSWHCGFHALIIHCHSCPVKEVPSLPFLSKWETDTFQLQAWVNPDNYSEVQTWLSYLVICHLRLSSFVFFIRGPCFFSSGEWGMQTSLPLCFCIPKAH